MPPQLPYRSVYRGSVAGWLALLLAVFPCTLFAEDVPASSDPVETVADVSAADGDIPAAADATAEEPVHVAQAVEPNPEELRLRAQLENSPDDADALVELADLLVRRGQYREAGMAYTRLLGFTLYNPAKALPYAICLWHLRQEYEAQAAMLRSMHLGKLSPANVRLLQTTLDAIYTPQNVIQSLAPDFPKPEETVALEVLETYWKNASDTIRELENAGDTVELERYLGTVMGDRVPARAYHSLWRSFALVHEGDLAAAERELDIAARSIGNPRLQLDVACASDLLQKIRRSPLSNEFLNRLTELYVEASSTAEDRLAGEKVTVAQRFRAVREAIRNNAFDAALAELDIIRPLIRDEYRRGQYIYDLADVLWGREEYARANQGYVVSSIIQKERYAMSASLYRMAEFAEMEDRKTDAVNFVVRSAGILREQVWKLLQTGNFFMQLEMPERAIAYFERALEASTTLASDADAFASLARVYRHIGQRERYLHYAGEYVATIEAVHAAGNEVTVDQDGMRYYFKGEILASQGKHQEAYTAYEQASLLLVERFRLAETLTIMADYREAAEDFDGAEALSVRSADLLPEQGWKARSTGNRLIRLGRTTKGIQYLERALEHSPSVKDKAASYAALADAYKSLGDHGRSFHYAREYIALVHAHKDVLTPAEEGLAAFYQGEIHSYNWEPDAAYGEYEIASRLLDNRFSRAEAFIRMATYHADRGNRAEAAALADRSAEEIPDQGWKQLHTGEFFLRLDMPAKALEYFKKHARLATPDDDTGAYLAMADAYKQMNRPEQYIQYAREYIAAISADGRAPSDAEKGLAAFYEAEIHTLQNEPDEAYQDYEQAVSLLTDKSRKSSAYMAMARRQAALGDREQALLFAKQAAETLPNAGMLRQVGDFVLRQGMPDEAFSFFERYARETAESQNQAEVYSTVAETYRKAGDEDNYLRFASEYVRAVTADGNEPTPTEETLAAYYEGDIAAAAGDTERAYLAYEKAVPGITDQFLLSDTLMKMAEIQAQDGDNELAASLAERSADALPNDITRLRRTGEFLLRLGMRDRAIAYIGRFSASDDLLAVYAAMAESSKQGGNREEYLNFAGEYLRAYDALDARPSPANQGLAAYYRGEVLATEGKEQEAYDAYEAASGLVENRYQRAEIYGKMASYQATVGNRDLAADLAVKSADALPDQSWKLRQTGDFLLRLGMQEQAYEYYRKYTELTSGPGDALSSLAMLAEANLRQNNRDRYLYYAGEYVAAAENSQNVTEEQAGLAAFYRGEVLLARDNAAGAYRAYEEALGRLSDSVRRADSLERMADIALMRGNEQEAAALMERSLALLPDDEGRLQRAADRYVRLHMPERAEALYERKRSLADTPAKRAAAYGNLAEFYRRQNDDRFLDYAREYVAVVTADGYAPTPDEQALAHIYQGDLYSRENDQDRAFSEYKAASALLTERYRLAETLMKMATIEAGRGNLDNAGELAERSLAQLPNEEWKVQQIAGFYNRLGMKDRALALYERRLLQADTTRERAEAQADLARFHQANGDDKGFRTHAKEFSRIVVSKDYEPTDSERGQHYLFKGDVHLIDDQQEQAYQSYQRAAAVFPENGRKADMLMKMATIRARQDRKEDAAKLGRQAVDLQPDSAVRVMDMARLFSQLGMPAEAVHWYERRLEMATTPEDKAAVYSSIAEAYKQDKEQEKYLQYARRYVETVRVKDFRSTPERESLGSFYEGEIAASEDRPDDAVRAYRTALPLITDKYRQSETLMRLARLETDRGNTRDGYAFAEEAFRVLPDQAWKAMEVGYFFSNHNQMDKAVEYFERGLALSTLPDSRAGAYNALLDAFRRMRDDERFIAFASEYIEAIRLKGNQATPDERGQSLFYQGEIASRQGDDDSAYSLYQAAADQFESRDRIYDMHMRMAALMDQKENSELATRHAETAAEVLRDNAARQRSVGDFLAGRNMMDKALVYYQRSLDLAKNDRERLAAFNAFAGAYKKMKDNADYIAWAQKYIDTIAAMGQDATREDKGNMAYYQAEILVAQGRTDEAYDIYSYAAQMLSEPFRKSEVLLAMARYNMKRGEKDLAATQAHAAADVTRDKGWRVNEAAGILADLGRFDEAVALVQRAIELNPLDNTGLYRNMSQLFARARNKKQAILTSELFIDSLYDKYCGPGKKPTRKEAEDLWNARSRHAGLTRPWNLGLDSYYYGRRYPKNGNYFLGMSHELYKNFRINDRLKGKFYLIYTGTMLGKFSGSYAYNNEERDWVSRQRLPDTERWIAGISVSPFKGRHFVPLSFKAEYLLGTGRNVEDDFRFRVTYDRSEGKAPRPCGTRWHYWKLYSNSTYSTRGADLTSAGYLRQGLTVANRPGGNLMATPYATITYDYGGKTVPKGRRWGSDAGLGISLRKYFGSNRYRTAPHNVEIDLYYLWPLTNGRNAGPGFTLSTQF